MIILLFIMIITTMLLPDRKMKKYAQFSLALVFMYFFIQPIRQIFNVNITRESTQIVNSVLGKNPSDDLTGSIELKKSEIEASNDAYVIEELANQLQDEMEEDFAQAFDYQLKSVEIYSEDDRNLDFNQYVFHFIISENKHHISQIDPVVISLDRPVDEQDLGMIEIDQEMLLWFSKKLEVDLGQVRIAWEGG